MNRRKFLMQAAVAGWSVQSGKAAELIKSMQQTGMADVANEEFWLLVRGMFEPDLAFIQLENGYFSPQPVSTRNYFQKTGTYINRKTSLYMRTEQENGREKSRLALAGLAGSEPEETALVRNTTEAMNIVIMGYPWQKGDEVIYSNQDYGSMVEQLKQAEKRYGIHLKKISLPIHPKSDEEIVNAYMDATGSNTRLILLTHMINLTGQILPASKIIAAAHAKQIEVLVDAAHSFAHVPCNFKDLDADYLGCSLHKWLCNPLGAGMLCVKKKHIQKIWPLFGDTGYDASNIRKFEHFGTHPCAVSESLPEAISFHQMIGAKLKESRLRYLQKSWTDEIRKDERFQMLTPVGPERSCALANVSVIGKKPSQVSKTLKEKYGIFTVAIEHDVIQGVRITPHLFNNPGETAKLVTALKEIAS